MEKQLSWDELYKKNEEENLASPLNPNIIIKEGEEKDGDNSGNGNGNGNGNPVPPWVIEERVRFSNWKYIPEKEIILNIKMQKQVELSKLNSSYVILNFIQSLSLRPEFEIESFIIELEKICFLKYNKSLTKIIEDHLNIAILWNKNREEEIINSNRNRIKNNNVNLEHHDKISKTFNN